jgi:hypothetical protein
MATDTALNAVATAIFVKLNGDATLTAKAPIKDHVPEELAKPYVVVGDDDELDWSTFARIGRDVAVTIHIWSDYQGWKEAVSILSDLIRLLDFPASPLSVSGWPTTVISLYEGSTKLRDPDGIARHIVARFRVYAEQ